MSGRVSYSYFNVTRSTRSRRLAYAIIMPTSPSDLLPTRLVCGKHASAWTFSPERYHGLTSKPVWISAWAIFQQISEGTGGPIWKMETWGHGTIKNNLLCLILNSFISSSYIITIIQAATSESLGQISCFNWSTSHGLEQPLVASLLASMSSLITSGHTFLSVPSARTRRWNGQS